MYSICMKKLTLAKTVADLDAQAQEKACLPALVLMESAGLQLFEAWKHQLSPHDRLVFLCGSGNNGGDALVAARYAFNAGCTDILLILLPKKGSDSYQKQREITQAYGFETLLWDASQTERVQEELNAATWIVDGLFGTGLSGALRGDVSLLVELANKSPAKKLSVDIPSGLGDEVPVSSLHIQADQTVTMGLDKLAMFHPSSRAACGAITTVNPSFPPFLMEKQPAAALLCVRNKARIGVLSSHEYKNSRGHVAVFSLSEQYTGAARLAARASFFARAGLVTLYCDREVLPIAASEAPSLMVKVYEGQALPSYDALLAGPGWGSGREALLKILMKTGTPMVLDADGIRCYAQMIKQGVVVDHGPLILTPHLGELRALCDACSLPVDVLDTPSSFFTTLEQLSLRLHATLVVKSSLVHIAAEGEKIIVLEGLNPSLGVGGSGDVLSGIIAALLAKFSDPVACALEGTLIHQTAGRLAHQSRCYYDSETLLSFVGKAVGEAEA